jgi:hypothetical protein
MEGNARTWFTPKQKAELWERCLIFLSNRPTQPCALCLTTAKLLLMTGRPRSRMNKA